MFSQAEHAHDATCSKPLTIILTKCFQEANALFQAVTHIDESVIIQNYFGGRCIWENKRAKVAFHY